VKCGHRTRARRWGSLALAAGAMLAIAATSAPSPLVTRLQGLGLPLTLVWPEGPPTAYMIFISGDGGWQSIDDGLAQKLKTRGVATIGWSSFKYFWNARKPAEVVTDLTRVIQALGDATVPIYVGGYSFGAEMAPVTVAKLADPIRARVTGLVLLAPSPSASFKVNPLDWVRTPPVDPRHRVDDAVRALNGLWTICLAGRDDDDAACDGLKTFPGVDVVAMPGDHHFGGSADGLAKEIGNRLLGKPSPETPPSVTP
jgi:type IV secretory pathway VirJ component